jgi:transaldolase
VTKSQFEDAMKSDHCASELLQQGIEKFDHDTRKLETLIELILEEHRK